MVKKETYENTWTSMFHYLTDNLKAMNDSKLFAGLMIIVLNVSSKFVSVKLSKTVESYLKHTFSRQILVFAMAWMGTRDIYIAFIISVIFVLCMEYLFNEESPFCCLSENFTSYHMSLLDNDKGCSNLSKEEVEKALQVLEKAKTIVNRAAMNEMMNSVAVPENSTKEKSELSHPIIPPPQSSAYPFQNQTYV